MRYSKAIGVLVAVGVVVCAGVGEGAWFMPLPQLPESTRRGMHLPSRPTGAPLWVQATTEVCFTRCDGRWGREIGIEKLNAGDFSFARGVSDDGSIVVGYDAGPGSPTAFRWNEPLGAVNIGDLSGGEKFERQLTAYPRTDLWWSAAVHRATGGEAFRWTNETGMVGIGDLDGGIVGSESVWYKQRWISDCGVSQFEQRHGSVPLDGSKTEWSGWAICRRLWIFQRSVQRVG